MRALGGLALLEFREGRRVAFVGLLWGDEGSVEDGKEREKDVRLCDRS